jgi:hypothetical protein
MAEIGDYRVAVSPILMSGALIRQRICAREGRRFELGPDSSIQAVQIRDGFYDSGLSCYFSLARDLPRCYLIGLAGSVRGG